MKQVISSYQSTALLKFMFTHAYGSDTQIVYCGEWRMNGFPNAMMVLQRLLLRTYLSFLRPLHVHETFRYVPLVPSSHSLCDNQLVWLTDRFIWGISSDKTPWIMDLIMWVKVTSVDDVDCICWSTCATGQEDRVKVHTDLHATLCLQTCFIVLNRMDKQDDSYFRATKNNDNKDKEHYPIKSTNISLNISK